MFDGIKNIFKNVKNEVSTKWRSMTTVEKVKIVVKGMTYFGCGWLAGDLVDTKHGKVVSACTYIAATGLATAGGMVAGEALDAAIDAWTDLAKESKNEFDAQKEND